MSGNSDSAYERDLAQMRRNAEAIRMNYGLYFKWIGLGSLSALLYIALLFIIPARIMFFDFIGLLIFVASLLLDCALLFGFGSPVYNRTHHGTVYVEEGTGPWPRLGGFCLGVMIVGGVFIITSMEMWF